MDTEITEEGIKINNELIKEKIEKYEEQNTGLRKINGAYVEAKILKINKEENKVYAEVTLNYQMEGRKEVYSNCEYDLLYYNALDVVKNLI